jgi:ribonuclease E
MSKRMLIDAAHAEETRVVVVDGTRIEDFDFESQSKKQLRGNIYLAKVTRVEPSLQAAFIEYGGNRHGFLAFNEIHPDYYQIPLADREAIMREEADEEENHHASAARGGDDEDGDDLDDDDDVAGDEAGRRNRRLMRRYKIQEVIRRRQIMLVQVVKEERGNKGAALTTYLSLAGRYGVLMPNTARGGGISRKITVATDRKRLKTVVQSLDVPQGMGLIVRTAGAKRTKAELKRDYEYLMRLWEDIREKTMHSVAPALIYEEEDLIKRAIRDMFDKDLDGIWIEGEAGYREARDFMRMIMPSQAKKIIPYRDPTPLFVDAKVEDHLAQIYSPVVPLKSGGYLVINQTEALVAVDVNSGKSTRERNIEATALKTNMEAAAEAARQLRLRDLAGLIVIDFIDMDEGKNNRAVEKVLKDSLKDDRARVQMGKISSFGLMEISRQRRRTGVLEGTTHVCEHCAGTGRVRSTESSALAALRAIEMEAVRGGGGAITLRIATSIGLYILNEKRAYLERVRQGHGLVVTIVVSDAIPLAEHEIERTETREFEADATVLRPSLYQADAEIIDDTADFEDEDEDEEQEEQEDTDDDEPIAAAARQAQPRRAAEGDDETSGDKPRRRRRRRGRRGDEPSERSAAFAASRGEGDGETDEAEDEEGEGAPGEAGDDSADGGYDAQGRKRRRRGRRGGRRMREDVRPGDPYAWSRPRVPEGDPYIWMDPAQIVPAPRPVEAEAPRHTPVAKPVARVEDTLAAEPVVMVAAASDTPTDMWVELPAKEEPVAKAPRARRSRAKAKPAEAEAEAVAEAVVEAPAEPVSIAAEPEPAPALVETPAPEPVAPAPVIAPEPAPVAREPEPAMAAEVDAAEISAPPAKPKRGWWGRRGG